MQEITGFFVELIPACGGAHREHGEDGQTLIEYGLIVALISIVAIVALTLVGGDISSVFNSVAGKLHS